MSLAKRHQTATIRLMKTFDVAVVGAGVFGAWTTYLLRQSGAKVILIDAYGPGNSRSSSGGESRIIRMGYGPDEIYSRSAIRSLSNWRLLFASAPTNSPLFVQTGVLWLAKEQDAYCEATARTLETLGVNIERLSVDQLSSRYPQFDFTGVSWGLLEHDSGALLARRAVQTVVSETIAQGTTILIDKVNPPTGSGTRLDSLTTTKATKIAADKYVFACGPWLPKLFPTLLQNIIHVTRQEVFFFGTPAGDDRFNPTQMPIWVDFNDLVYALPNLESRGFKLAIDAHGADFDPDTGDRVVSEAGVSDTRTYLRKRVPSLAKAPIVETRVCQYENTSNGDFLIDRHPTLENVWLVGGGSGHGFKHGPVVGEHVTGLIAGTTSPEARFALSTKRLKERQIF